MKHQELTDRLVVASEEQDVLYVMYWLNEMKEMNCLREAINNKHSWKGYSALESVTRSPLTQLRRVILELLLLYGANETSEEPSNSELVQRNKRFNESIVEWRKSGNLVEANHAKQLAALQLEEAANYIDLNLPLPPNPEALTGCQDLPARPSSLRVCPLAGHSSQSVRDEVESCGWSNAISVSQPPLSSPQRSKQVSASNKHVQDSRVQLQQQTYSPVPPSSSSLLADSASLDVPSRHNLLSPASSHTLASTSAAITQPTQPSHIPAVPSSPSPSPPRPTRQSHLRSALSNPPELVQLHVGNLPRGFPTSRVRLLFDEIGVRCLVKFCRNKDRQRSYAFVLVELDQAMLCLQQLHGKILNHVRLWCNISLEKPGHEHKEKSIIFDRLPISPRVALHQLPSRSQHNLLVFNLPLNQSDSALQVVSLLPNVTLFRLFQQNQSVAFAQADSSVDADLLIRRLEGYQIDGRQLEVVRVDNGMSADQAIRLHLETLQTRRQFDGRLSSPDPSRPHSLSLSLQNRPEPVNRKRKNKFEEMEDRKSKWKDWRKKSNRLSGGHQD